MYIKQITICILLLSFVKMEILEIISNEKINQDKIKQLKF